MKVQVNLQSLKFFKIHERGLLPDNKTWATDEMGYTNNSTPVTIPHDIKAGKYIVRHELIAMHFATEDSVWTRAGPDFGPQVR
jgi:cellulase